MAAVPDEPENDTTDTQPENNSNANENQDESKTKDITQNNNANDPNNNNNKTNTKSDDDKNIHVPKDKKLQIEYVSVKDAFIHNEAVFYDIHIKTLSNYWHVTKRYSQFEQLHNRLISITKDKLPLLPGKHYKWFTDHTKAPFIEKRRALLDNYVKKLIKTKNISTSQCVVNFFHNDKSAETIIENDNNNDNNDNDNDNDDVIEGKEENNDNNNKENNKRRKRESDEWDFPSDQEVTNIEIQSTRKMTDHVLYQICVSNSHKRGSFREWTVLKRFTQFYDMDLKLRASIQMESPQLLPKLPPAPSRKFKFVHDHMDDDFIEERRVLLQNYLSKLLRIEKVAINEDFLQFLGVDM